MSDDVMKEIASLRRELRERLTSEITDGTKQILARLQELSRRAPTSDREGELLREVERWKLRFELLGAIQDYCNSTA